MSDPTHTWAPFDWATLDSQPTVTPSLSGLVYPGHTHLLSGEPESGKSFLGLHLCAEVIAAGGSALWVDLEQTPRVIRERLTALGLAPEEIAERFVLLSPQEPLSEDLRPVVEALVAKLEPRLVVVDSMIGLISLHGYNPNDGAHIEALYREVLSRFRVSDAALVVLDHVPKDRENRDKFAIGSERKVGGIDVHVRVECVEPFARGRDGRIRLKTMKDRLGWLPRGELATVAVRSDAASGALAMEVKLAGQPSPLVAADAWKPTGLMEKVSRLVEAAAPKPLSKNRILEAKLGRREYVEQAIDALVAEKYLRRSDGPRNALVHALLRPYREAAGEPHRCSPDTPPSNDDDRARWVADMAKAGCAWSELEGQLGELADDERDRLFGEYLAAHPVEKNEPKEGVSPQQEAA